MNPVEEHVLFVAWTCICYSIQSPWRHERHGSFFSFLFCTQFLPWIHVLSNIASRTTSSGYRHRRRWSVILSPLYKRKDRILFQLTHRRQTDILLSNRSSFDSISKGYSFSLSIHFLDYETSPEDRRTRNDGQVLEPVVLADCSGSCSPRRRDWRRIQETSYEWKYLWQEDSFRIFLSFPQHER